ncbi:MAG: mannonate dehydratase, partial [Defluviitaleaceae bacterium]|nr:mannonate dehydratase [Defluviitaleaceae bacterium]
MKMTFRWFGENEDSVKLWQIKQIPGVSGIMGVLSHKAAGEVWTDGEIQQYIQHVHKSGLECEIIESVNVHEDIKLGLPTRDAYIANYITTIKNLAKHGVKVIVYNFMPVFDWLRTDLARLIPSDGSFSLYFDESELGEMGPAELVAKTAKDSGGFILPGWEPERLAELELTLIKYKDVSPDDLLCNYKYFIDAIMPTCEEVGVKMAVHPDDPAWPIFGLPRIAHTLDGFNKILAFNNSPAHTLCLCT